MSENEVAEVTFDVVGTGKAARPFTFTAPAMVWGDVIRMLNENASAAQSKAVSKEVSAVYSGTFEDDEEVAITPTAKNATLVADAFNQLGLEVNLDSIQQPVSASSNGTTRTRTPKEPTFCLFSGEPTSGGKFRPGGDMKLKGALLKIIDNADLGDNDEVSVGLGQAARNYTVQGAIDRLLEFPWNYTEEGLRARRQKALSDRDAKIEAAAKREQERAAAKAAKEAPAEAVAA